MHFWNVFTPSPAYKRALERGPYSSALIRTDARSERRGRSNEHDPEKQAPRAMTRWVGPVPSRKREAFGRRINAQTKR